MNQEKALVGAFSVIVQPVVEPMEHCTALCVSLTVHGALLALHQPYLPSPRSAAKRQSSSRSSVLQF